LKITVNHYLKAISQTHRNSTKTQVHEKFQVNSIRAGWSKSLSQGVIGENFTSKTRRIYGKISKSNSVKGTFKLDQEAKKLQSQTLSRRTIVRK
jgi:hypothetical protein